VSRHVVAGVAEVAPGSCKLITAKGREIVSDIFPEHAGEITLLMARLSPEEQDTLRELCRKLGTAEVAE